MNALVIGFYDRGNLGDEMFKEVFPHLLPGHSLTFRCIDDIKLDPTASDLKNEYSAIILGGGDVINDYFLKKFSAFIAGYTGMVLAVSVGYPFPSYDPACFRLFDHVFLRYKGDIPVVQKQIGAEYTHYLPDLGFLLPPPSAQRKEKRVGFFLAQPLMGAQNLRTMEDFICWLQGRGYSCHLYAFNEGNNPNENDSMLNDKLLVSDLGSLTGAIKGPKIAKAGDMLEDMALLDLAVCSRFHSHVFSIISGIPFLSVANTRKVKTILEEINYPEELNVSPDSSLGELQQAFVRLEESGHLRETLRAESDRRRFQLSTLQVSKILRRGEKRIPLPIHRLPGIIQGYNYALRLLKDEGLIFPSASSMLPLDKESAKKISELLCFYLTGMTSSKYVYGTTQNLQTRLHELWGMIDWIIQDRQREDEGKIFLDHYRQDTFRGFHRSGWHYVHSHLKSLSSPQGTLCDTYLDRTFLWGKVPLLEAGIIPYTSPWIGFLHHGPNTEYSPHNVVAITEDHTFQRSLPTCQALICLSEYLGSWMRNKIQELGYSVPVVVLPHPTLIVKNRFTMEKWGSNGDKMLINIGAWYRNPFAIYQVQPPHGITLAALRGPSMDEYFPPASPLLSLPATNDPLKLSNKWERYLYYYLRDHRPELLPHPDDIISGELFSQSATLPLQSLQSLQSADVSYNKQALYNHIDGLVKRVKTLGMVDNDEYDDLLSRNVVFLNLVECSAANTIIECIIRDTPIILNRLPAVVEYLGEDYPLYYDKIDEIGDLLQDDKIREAHHYLSTRDKSTLSIDNFLQLFRDRVYPLL